MTWRGSSAATSVTKSACPVSITSIDDGVGRAMDARFEVAHHSRREPLVDQSAVAGVERRVHVQHHQALLGDLLLSELEGHRPLRARAESLEVAIDRDAIVVSGHRPEAGPARLVLPVNRVVASQVGQPGVGHARNEGPGVRQVDGRQVSQCAHVWTAPLKNKTTCPIYEMVRPDPSEINRLAPSETRPGRRSGRRGTIVARWHGRGPFGETPSMTVLVTGGAGYIGSHTVRLLKERGRDVVALDSMEFGHAAVGRRRPPRPGRRREIDGRCSRPSNRFGVDSVIHFAAYKSPAESMAQPQRYFENNSCHTASLLETLHEWQSPPVRLLLHLRRLRDCLVRAGVRGCPGPAGEPVRGEQGRHRAGASAGTTPAWDLRSVSLRYFNAAGAWPDGSIGEDWTVTINLIPLLMKAMLGRSAPLQAVRHGLPDPRRDCRSGTTCTSSTWPTPTSRRSSTSSKEGRRRC